MQFEFGFLVSIIPDPPVFQKGEGWYQVALFYYPTKESLDIGKADQSETLIYAKTLLSAKQKATKWANSIRKKSLISSKFPIDGKWEKVKTSTNQYNKYWEKAGLYCSCNPRLFLIPNNFSESV